MERQKPRVSQNSIGQGYRGYYIDGVSRPLGRLPQNPAYGHRPMPNFSERSKVESARLATERSVDDILPQTRQSLSGMDQPSLLEANLNKASLPPASTKPKSRFKKVLKPAMISLGVLVIGIGVWFGFSILRNVDKVFHGNVFSDAHALISGSPLKESGGRVNILLAGNSADDPGHHGANLTDSIMVISYDPTTKSGFILSIPRDLWVHVPSMGHQKINAAGDVKSFKEPGYPSGSMGLLQKIVEKDLGIPIDYEALINYAAFKNAVDTVGGISIDIKSPDPRGLYDAYTHLKLPNGMVNLTGEEALNLARARGDNVAGDISYGFPDSDFTRTMYQREMLKALFKKALSVGVLSNPLKISSLFSSFSSNVQTDLTLGDVMSLVRLTDGLNLSKLHSEAYSFGGSSALLGNYLSPSGEEALIPSAGLDNFSQLKAFYQQLTSSNPVAREAPTVTLLNGSNVSGLAARERTILGGQGFDVVAIANATHNYSSSMIVNNVGGSKPFSEALLSKDVHGQVVTTSSGSQEAGEATNYNSNFVVIMGENWDNSGPTGTPVQN